MLTDLLHRLRALFMRRVVEQEIDDELRFHLDRQAEKYRRAGDDPEQARRHAWRDLGGLDQVKEEYRDSLGVRLLGDLRRDVLLAGRVLRRQPGFAVAAALTLALGTGATTAVFSLIDVLLLRPLPVHRPEELAHVYTSCRAGDVYCASSYPEFIDYRSQNRTFAGMAAFQAFEVSVGSGGGSWVAVGDLVSTDYFSLLGVVPHVGRLISPGSNVAADPPVVLAYDAWVARFGGDPSLIGQTIRLSGSSFRVVGVAPPGFHGTRLRVRPDLWVPFDNVSLLHVGAGRGYDILASRDTRWIAGTVGRLKPGTTIGQAQADMRAVSDRLQEVDPTRLRRFVTVEEASRAALPPTAAGDITRFVLLLMCGVAATLFIGCANVSGLFLARSAARRPELELRRALGASRARLVRQLLAEYALLAIAGTAVGLLLANGAVSILAAYDLPGALSIASLDLELNSRVLVFGTLLLVITASVGLLPAFGTTRDLAHASRRATRRTGGQAALLATQVALTLVLLVGAGLFIRSLQRGLLLDPGISSRGVVMAEIAPLLERHPPARTQSLLMQATARLEGLPGVTGASASNRPPLTRGSGFLAQTIEGYAPRPGEEIRFESYFIGPQYFRVLGIPVRAGREFTQADTETAPTVAVISRSMARRYWAGRDPLGTRLQSRSFPAPVEVVGVVDDVAVGLDGTAEPFVYMPLRQNPRFLSTIPIVLLARTGSDPALLAASMRNVLQELDPSVPITGITTLDSRIAQLLMPQRFGSVLLSALAGLTVVLVTIGVVGTVSYGVARRRREIGIRIALGARRTGVVATMTRGTMVSVAIGTIIGLVGAVILGRLATAFLYGIQPTDVVALAGSVGVLLVAAGLASFLPAWRAAGIDAAQVLKDG